MAFYPFQDDEINQQSQLAEKLKQQMLDQDEVNNNLKGVFFFEAPKYIYQICCPVAWIRREGWPS